MTRRIWRWENFSQQELRQLSQREIRTFLRAIENIKYAALTEGEKRLLELIRATRENWVRQRRLKNQR